MNITPFVALSEQIKAALLSKEWLPFLEQAYHENRWFTVENSVNALLNIADMLSEPVLKKWAEYYEVKYATPKKVGVIMAGNIPAVGFHDAMCVLLSGHKLYAKLSSNDTVLMKLLLQTLTEIEPKYSQQIYFPEKLTEIDALIATGSDNSARYFEYYFANTPKIIRQNRTSLAVLSGSETIEEYRLLANDIFMYFGLGCRNVSKLFVPEGFNFSLFFDAINEWNIKIINNKYLNNVEYYRAIYVMNSEPFTENGCLILKESHDLFSPVGVIYYQYYANSDEVKSYIQENKAKLQCIVCQHSIVDDTIAFGQTQSPKLHQYADGVDTLQFLNAIN